MTVLPNPILVKVIRGGMTESWHRGAGVSVNAQGQIISSLGDAHQLIYPHSSIKPIQALSMVESGAMEAFGLGDEVIALACSSHTGSAEHIRVATAWMAKIGVDENVLECGIHAPLDKAMRQELLKTNTPLTPIYHTCSGKHLAFVTTCLHLKLPVKGYSHRTHPAQQRAEAILETLTQYDLSQGPDGIDGCGIPVVAVPLYNLALAMANFVNPEFHSPERAFHIRRILDAMVRYPFLVGGAPKLCTKVLELLKGRILLKDGNEGVYAAAIPEQGLGIALKIDDGSLKAADVVMANMIKQTNFLTEDKEVELVPFLNPQIHNFTKTHTGCLRSEF